MEDPSEYDIVAMPLLLTMKKCIANATADNGIGGDQTHLVGRIQGLFLCHLVTAKILQVNDIETARYTKWLRDHTGWTGTPCFSVHLEDDLKNRIVQELHGLPYRTFSNLFGATIFHTPTH